MFDFRTKHNILWLQESARNLSNAETVEELEGLIDQVKRDISTLEEYLREDGMANRADNKNTLSKEER
jgi:hypothetical protein